MFETITLTPYLLIIILVIIGIIILISKYYKNTDIAALLKRIYEQENTNNELYHNITRLLFEQQQHSSKNQLEGFKTITESLQRSLTNHANELSLRIEKLIHSTDIKLKEISGQVDRRLSEGFEKTTETFIDVIKRLAIIDEAQKKIAVLSNNIINLQEILADKRARGAFGEIQLSALLHNVLPKENFELQYTLSNNKRVDCILFLPQPTGNIAIDAKFPAVENLISGCSYKPGDIIQTRLGLNIEITNTDAEGRLILADALALACEWEPELIIDIATLTGAARIALGPDILAMFTPCDKLADEITIAMNKEQEPIWRMPLYQPYLEFIRSKIADFKNASGYGGGAITAALFLQQFINPKIQWAHFDINAYNSKSTPGKPEGGEAECIKGIYRYLKERYDFK